MNQLSSGGLLPLLPLETFHQCRKWCVLHFLQQQWWFVGNKQEEVGGWAATAKCHSSFFPPFCLIAPSIFAVLIVQVLGWSDSRLRLGLFAFYLTVNEDKGVNVARMDVTARASISAWQKRRHKWLPLTDYFGLLRWLRLIRLTMGCVGLVSHWELQFALIWPNWRVFSLP